MLGKTSVCHNIEEIKIFLAEYQDAKFCLYLAYKSESEWDKSTSRVYMNHVSNALIYLPVNIEKDNYQLIEEIYNLRQKNSQIIAINQTQPHKSNPVIKKWFKGQNIPNNVDAMIKDKKGHLQPFDLNGPSFVDWFESDVSDFKDKQVVILGVGGVGEPIARMVSKRHLKKLFLIDVISKQTIAGELSKNVPTIYMNKLENVSIPSQDIIFINCSGKEGLAETGVEEFLQKCKSEKNIFVDLRPQLNIDIVETAKNLGWNAYTGYGMNARNDYTLLSKICITTNIKPPSFEEFQKLVKEAS